ncbi:MAG: hypothetical protein AMXMBFR64_18330 [Myxococcales bacterium]
MSGGAWTPQGLTRRRFLKWTLRGLAGVTALAGATGGSLLALRGCAPSVDGLTVLSDHGYRTLTALAHVVLPDGGAFPEGASTIDMARLFDGYLADEPEQNQSDLAMALHLLEFGPVLYDLRFRTFSNLTPEERLTHFEGWMTSDSLTRRKVAVAFRKFLYLVFYDQPAVWPRLGYGGPVA